MDKTKIAVGVFDKLANEYQDKFMNVDLYGDSLNFFCNKIKKEHPEILEVACGPGNITQYLLNQRPDFKILGIDLSPRMIALAKINNPKAEFELMDCRDIESISKKFDGIMCSFCLPYLTKEEAIKLIEDASLLLKPGGLFYLSTMEDDYGKSGFKKGSFGDEIYMHYYQADFLTNTLKRKDFKILNCKRKTYTIQDGTTTVDLMIIAEK